MRVIAGEARGRTLRGPKSPGTRPTSDLIRGAIFSMLEARGASFTNVLDLYAGTGALGIEALSRGADDAVFVDGDRAACAVIRANLELIRMTEHATVIQSPLPAALARVRGGPFGLIFLDPPYELASLADTLAALAGSTLMGEDTTIVYEHGHRTMPPEGIGPLPRQVTRAHGSTAVSLYYAVERAGSDQPSV